MKDDSWKSWGNNHLTKSFMKYIFFKKIECQKELLDKKYNQEVGSFLLGGYRSLSDVLEKFNELKGR